MSISLSVGLSGSVAGLNLSTDFSSSFDVAGNNAIANIQNIGAVREVLNFGDIAFPCGVVYVENLSETNTLTLSLDADGVNVIAVIPPGAPPFVSYKMAAAPFGVFNSADQSLVIATEL